MMEDLDCFFSSPPTHYRIDGGRLWDIGNARFVSDPPAEAVIVDLYANGQPGDADYLRRTLEFYRKTVGWELLTLDEHKAAKLKEINEACDAALASLTASYPSSELLTFDKQEVEARALLANPDAATPFLTPLASARGMTTTELARKVVAKADAFTAASGYVIGLRQKDEDALKVAQTAEDVAAIVPNYTVPGVS